MYSGKFGPPIEGGALREAYGKYLIGWAEFDFTARETGWYKFDVDMKPFLGPTRFLLDPGVANGGHFARAKGMGVG